MKTCSSATSRIVLLLGSASLALSTTPLLADDSHSSGLYIGTDAGVNLADKLNVSGYSYSFDPGVRWDFTIGYGIKLTDQLSLAPEVEAGIIYNAFDNVSAGGASAPASGELVQVPVLANAVLNWQFAQNWVIYGGGGAGYDCSISSASTSGQNYSLNELGDECNFAWQGEAGIKYKIGRSELGVGYKYLASGHQSQGNQAILASYTFHF